MKKEIALQDIRIDGGTQCRPIDDDVVLRYKELIQDGAKFPPVEIVFDGQDNWLVDGSHRLFAHRKAGKNYITANIEEGTKRDAIWNSFSANSMHGFPRQPGTVKRVLIDKIFPDPEWSRQTDETVGNWIGVSRSYISQCRKAYEDQLTDKKNPKRVHSTHSGQNEPKGENDSKHDEKPVVDSTGQEVPEHLVEVFSRVGEIKERIKLINLMFREIKEAKHKNDPLYENCKLESLKTDVGNLRRNLRFTIPYAVCRYCGGDVNNADCRACEGRGFVNEMMYIATPKELK